MESEIISKTIELLAPAGNLAAALAAYDCGADAVYAGLSKFNARERTENFTIQEMSKLSSYAKSHQKKFYVTLNTLIKESELPEIVEYLAELSKLLPDAIIVQDYGVIRIIREYFPWLVIHASTQMGFHNSAGLKLAAESGVSRVIMERQVTLTELKLLIPNSPVEIEVFIHGALCCSLSGQCLFSSWQGGWSGNRGKCKQPCRRRFFSRSGNGFFFSTQDLYTLDMIHELKTIGVVSFKIEGRLRKPDYVARAVSAYRMILDAEEKPSRELLNQAKNILAGTYGRKWSSGFFNTDSMKTLIQHDSLGVAGMLCGNVIEVIDNGFKMETLRRIHLGDRIRIQSQSGDEGPAMTITKMFKNDSPVKYSGSGEQCFICCDKTIQEHGMVYKIGESCDEMIPRIAALPVAKTPLNLHLKVSDMEISVCLDADGENIWRKKINLAPATRHALDSERLAEEFAASRSNIFCMGQFTAEISGQYFLPSSILKEIRREFWLWADENVNPKNVAKHIYAAMDKFRHDYQRLRGTIPDNEKETVMIRLDGGCTPAKSGGNVASSVYSANKKVTEAVLPCFCPEDRLKNLRSRIAEAYRIGIRRFRITSFYGAKLFDEYPDVKLLASFPLPVCNSMAAEEMRRCGFVQIQAWLELEQNEIRLLAGKSPLTVEVYRYGRPVLLATRAGIPVPDGHIRDARNNGFSVRNDKNAGLTYVYPKSVMSIPRIPGTIDFYDLTNAHWNEEDIFSFNFTSGLM